MIVRALRVDVPPDRVDAVVEAYRATVRPIHERAVGLLQHYVLTDRLRGRIEIIGIWDSPASIAAIADELEPARARLWAEFGRDPVVEIYDVADVLRT